jgi:hypothetical protein
MNDEREGLGGPGGGREEEFAEGGGDALAGDGVLLLAQVRAGVLHHGGGRLRELEGEQQGEHEH